MEEKSDIIIGSTTFTAAEWRQAVNYLKQFCIILAFSFAGEILNRVIPLPVPASIYGIILLFICLETGIVKKSDVRSTGAFLIEIMPVMFIPAAVGLLESWEVIKPSCIQFIAVTIISTFTVMAVAGRITQFIIRKGRKRVQADD